MTSLKSYVELVVFVSVERLYYRPNAAFLEGRTWSHVFRRVFQVRLWQIISGVMKSDGE